MNTDALTPLEDLAAANGIELPLGLEVTINRGASKTIAWVRRVDRPHDETDNRFKLRTTSDAFRDRENLCARIHAHYGADAACM